MPKQAIDWSQLWYPGPRQPFTPEEMARAGADRPSRTLIVALAINVATMVFVVLQLTPDSQGPRLTAAMVALVLMGSAAARWLWVRPWRQPLMQASMSVLLGTLLLSLLARWRIGERDQQLVISLALWIGAALVCMMLWMLVIWRAEQINGRLRESAEREKSVEMAQRLASAQLAPHFLFNTLASVQHWVATHDARAGPLLQSLTGYLRATLPMFSRPLHAAGEEIELVRRYLEVMQARLGTRLKWSAQLPAEMSGISIPPGVLLTLVENAVEYAIDPRVAGGVVEVTGRIEGQHAFFVVQDDGPGLAAGTADGTGLANIRERLALTHGAQASLVFTAAADGGCCATVQIDLTP